MSTLPIYSTIPNVPSLQTRYDAAAFDYQDYANDDSEDAEKDVRDSNDSGER